MENIYTDWNKKKEKNGARQGDRQAKQIFNMRTLTLYSYKPGLAASSTGNGGDQPPERPTNYEKDRSHYQEDIFEGFIEDNIERRFNPHDITERITRDKERKVPKKHELRHPSPTNRKSNKAKDDKFLPEDTDNDELITNEINEPVNEFILPDDIDEQDLATHHQSLSNDQPGGHPQGRGGQGKYHSTRKHSEPNAGPERYQPGHPKSSVQNPPREKGKKKPSTFQQDLGITGRIFNPYPYP